MKKMFAIALAISAAITTLATEIADDELGGEITVWPKDPGKFVFINAQTAVANDVIAKPIDSIASEFAINIQKVDGAAPDIRTIPATLKGLGAKGGIWIVNDPAMPISLVAAENGWAILNVAPLIADNLDSAKLEKRIVKFVLRTFANINGIGDSTMMPACVMKQAVGVVGVDALSCASYSPEACSKIVAYLAMAGYKRCQTGTYYDACEEGWAPTPTNAIQKAIWDKVHQLPTQPLTIQRESARKGMK